MHPPFATRRPALPQGAADHREGRDSELSRRITALLLFPRLDARPGGWLLVLAAACTYVAVRALELGSF
jgi:hypothetical protein